MKLQNVLGSNYATTRMWIDRHVNDPFVKKARKEGYPSRSAYKLLQIHRDHHILHPGNIVVDIGAAPGGWSQVAAEIVRKEGRVIANDLLELKATQGIEFVQGDFTQELTRGMIFDCLKGRKANVVLSDMAPNLSGIMSTDHMRSVELIHEAFNFAKRVLVPGGTFCGKLFQGSQEEILRKELSISFKKVIWIKPEASRKVSSERYILAKIFYT